MKDSIIAGLDIGSNTIRLVAAQLFSSSPQGESQLQIIGAAEVPSGGINKGVITSIEDAVSAISGCLEKIERMIGMPVENIWVGISGAHITSQASKGVVAVSRANGEINESDVERVIEAARTVATPPNYEILHVIPKSFIVDNQAGIKDPLGMTGVRLEVEAQIIQGLSAPIKNLTKSIYRTGLDIEDLVFSILSTSEAVLTSRQKELGVVLANIGGATTSLVIFEEGDILHSAILPIGSDHITSDIAIGLRASIDTAERVKLEYGTCLPQDIGKKEEINLKDLGGEEIMVSRKYIAEIIEARVEEIFEKIDEELKKVQRSGLLPAGVVLTGGGAKLPGILELAKRKLRLPASLGLPQGLISAVNKIDDPVFATAVGLVIWGSEIQAQNKGRFSLNRFKTVDEVTTKMKKWFKSLIP